MDNIFLLALSLLPMVVGRSYKQLCTTIIIVLLSAVYGTVAICSLLDLSMPVEWMEQFAISPVASIFALLFCASTLPVILSESPKAGRSSFHYSVFYGSAIALFISVFGVLHSFSSPYSVGDTIWNVAFNWEVMGISSFVLMLLKSEKREFFHSAVLYFVVMHLGFFFILAGLLSLGSQEGFLLGRSTIDLRGWLLLFVGFGIKSAVYPLSFWLPHTYRASLGGGAALMAGTSTNIGLFGILTITYSAVDLQTTSLVLIVLGLLAALLSSLSMIRSATISRVLSLSSIENLGVVLFGFGFSFMARHVGATEIAALAMVASVVKLFSHGVAKATLLSVAGKLYDGFSSDVTSSLGGALRRMPQGGLLFAAGGMSLSGMPLFGGFIGEFFCFVTLIMALKVEALSIVAIVGILVLALSSASTIFNITKVFTVAFLGTERGDGLSGNIERPSAYRLCGYLLFVLMLTVAGWALAYLMIFNISSIFSFNEMDMGRYWEMFSGIAIVSEAVIVLVILLWWFRSRLERRRTTTISDTWGCGNLNEGQRGTEPTAESFSYEAGVVVTLPVEKRARKIIKKRISPLRIIRRWTSRLALFQTGRTNHYVLHIIWFLALVLILTLCDVL